MVLYASCYLFVASCFRSNTTQFQHAELLSHYIPGNIRLIAMSPQTYRIWFLGISLYFLEASWEYRADMVVAGVQ